MTTTDPAALAAAIRTAQQTADAGDWTAAARQLTHAARLATALAAPAPTPRTARPARPHATDTAGVDAVGIADHLRGLPDAAAGAAYLDALALGAPALRAVAAALNLSRVDRLSAPALRARCVRQAITARDKFAGLRQGWQG